MRQYQLTLSQIGQVFHIADGEISIIASTAPGKNSKEQTHNAYVLQGISCLLASGNPSFTDKDARKVCQDLGCFNRGNHATYMGDKGNVLAGSKDKGWSLTGPGLKQGADIVKELTKEGAGA